MTQLALEERWKHQGIENGGLAAHREWLAAMEYSIEQVALSNRTFQVDDVTDYMHEHWKPIPTTHDARAMGAVTSYARRSKMMVPGGYVPSKRFNNRKGPRTLWKSLIYNGDEVN